MYGGTRAHDYQIVEADQYRGVQVWGLYHVGADFSIVENTSEHWGRGKTVVSDQWLVVSRKGGRGENAKTGRLEGRKKGGRMEEWKEWEGRGQEGGVWGGWVRGLSGSLSESQITRIKGFRGLGLLNGILVGLSGKGNQR